MVSLSSLNPSIGLSTWFTDIAAMVIELDKDVLTSEITSTLLPLILTTDEENIIRVSHMRPDSPVLTLISQRLTMVLMKI
jgi:hypothetical protein